MTAELKPYNRYEEVDLPWLQRIPAGWRLLRAKNIFEVIDVKSTTGSEELLTVSANDGVVPRSQKTVTMFKAESYIGHKLCWPGDLVVNSLWAWMQGLGVSEYHGLVSSAYSVYRPRPEFRVYSRYFNYLFRSAAYKWELLTRSKGIWLSRLQLSDPVFLTMPVLIPREDEQDIIVRYLDYVDGRVRRYIRARKQLVALLTAQKQAIIHRAVTGLDSSATRKPTLIPNLDSIPANWEERRIKTLAQFVTSGSRGWAQYYSDHGPMFLRIGNLSTKSIDLRLNRVMHVSPPDDAEGARTRVQPNDVLLSITAQIGAVGLVPHGIGEAYVNQHTALIRPKTTECNPIWLAYSLLSEYGKTQCTLLMNGGTKTGLTLDDVRGLRILIPRIAEQEAIIRRVSLYTKDLDRALTQAEHEINLIREYRASLISRITTGELNVTAAMPDTVDRVLNEAFPGEMDEVVEDESEMAEHFESAVEEWEA